MEKPSKEEIKEVLKGIKDLDFNRVKEKSFNYEEKQAEKKFYESIKNCVPLEKYKNIVKYIKLIHNGNTKINSVIIEGETGLGKSTLVKAILKEIKINFVFYNSYSTPLSFYKNVYLNRDKTLLLDDIEGLFKDRKGISILKALLNTDEVKFIRYDSTSEKLDVPSEFIFNGKMIILSNDIHKHIDDALISRGIYRKVNFTFKEILDIAKSIIKFHHKNLKEKEVKEILNFIKENADVTTINFNFRTINKIVDFYKFDKQNWRELALEEIPKDEELVIIIKLMRKNIPVSIQIKQFIEETGKSRATYFRLKKKLKVSKSHSIKNAIKFLV